MPGSNIGGQRHAALAERYRFGRRVSLVSLILPPQKSSNSKLFAWNRPRSRGEASAPSVLTTGLLRARLSRLRRTTPHNTIIVDLDRAPRNAQGLVEAVADVEILRPTVAANGNRRLFYEVLNRGGKLGFALFNDIPAVRQRSSPRPPTPGNGFLMNRGYTMVWADGRATSRRAPGG